MRSSKAKKYLNQIINKYVAGSASAEEKSFVEAYYDHLGKGGDKHEQPDEEMLLGMEEANFKAILTKINSQQKRVKTILNYRNVAAALIVVTLGICSYFVFNDHKFGSKSTSIAKNIDVLPGTEKATLTLADGSTVELDLKNDEIIKSANLSIAKTENGQLIYKVNPSSNLIAEKIAFNTIATPKGGQYQVLLQDGSRVWLNAASSLRYPVVFAGNERKVELIGEAYFEVAKNPQSPFKVVSKNQQVEVLGTHFNINSYANEKDIKTTLLQGSIKISTAKTVRVLKPGEQSLIGNDDNPLIKVSSSIDTEDEIAWKNGQFRFSNAGLKSILSQLERWYDIKIDYASVPDRRFNGMVPRKARLSEVLNMLELTGDIKFEIKEGKQLKVIAR